MVRIEMLTRMLFIKMSHFSPRVSETCIVATSKTLTVPGLTLLSAYYYFLGDNGDITRMCGREDESVPKCVNDDTFCFCWV